MIRKYHNHKSRQTHGTMRKSHTTITRHLVEKLSKATSSLFHLGECYCCYVCLKGPSNSLGHMETKPWLKVSSDRLMKPGIEPTTPGLEFIKLEFILRLKIKQPIFAFYLESETLLKFYNLEALFTRRAVYPQDHIAPIKMIAIYKCDSYPF